MADNACPNTTAFISAGGLSKNPIYQNVSAPVNKLRTSYGNGANTPATDPNCNLAGSSNIFGRLVDGVEKENVCTTQAKTKHISGTFIHIEQDTKERDDWNGWIKAIKEAFNLKFKGKSF
uniref:Uncharacterized protein n=1 Tax=Panagrolaimus sp. ES5 TaxID=591445 RepID=A0AC34FMR6_9BILA